MKEEEIDLKFTSWPWFVPLGPCFYIPVYQYTNLYKFARKTLQMKEQGSVVAVPLASSHGCIGINQSPSPIGPD